MSNTTTPATIEELAKENEALKAQLAEIEKTIGDYRGANTVEKAAAMFRDARMQAEIYSRMIIAMQACIIEAELAHEDGDVPEYMSWLVNTLAGPGFLPDMEEVRLLDGAQGRAQAFADKAHADLKAHYEKYPLPENKELEVLRAELARWADPHQHWLVQQHDGGVYLCLGTGTCSDMVAPPEGWALEAPVLQLLTNMHDIIQAMRDSEAKTLQSLAGTRHALEQLSLSIKGRAPQAPAADTPLETSEADAVELPPEVVARFVTPQ